MSWIVTVNRPYYPSVREFDNGLDAFDYYDSVSLSVKDDNGQYKCTVYIAEVKAQTPFLSGH